MVKLRCTHRIHDIASVTYHCHCVTTFVFLFMGSHFGVGDYSRVAHFFCIPEQRWSLKTNTFRNNFFFPVSMRYPLSQSEAWSLCCFQSHQRWSRSGHDLSEWKWVMEVVCCHRMVPKSQFESQSVKQITQKVVVFYKSS